MWYFLENAILLPLRSVQIWFQTKPSAFEIMVVYLLNNSYERFKNINKRGIKCVSGQWSEALREKTSESNMQVLHWSEISSVWEKLPEMS